LVRLLVNEKVNEKVTLGSWDRITTQSSQHNPSIHNTNHHNVWCSMFERSEQAFIHI
jgi:hypothetical protein